MTANEKPIIFSGEMVRAILAGTKTQTRRLVTPQPKVIPGWAVEHRRGIAVSDPADDGIEFYNRAGVWTCTVRAGSVDAYLANGVDNPRCPYGAPGDRLWVRETFATSQALDGGRLDDAVQWQGWPRWYRADGYEIWTGATDGGPGFMTRGAWRPSIHMPRWAARIDLEVTGVRVERLQGISEEDARAEGVEPWTTNTLRMADPAAQGPKYRPAFEALWDSLNAARAPWASNPWVWVVSFRRVRP